MGVRWLRNALSAARGLLLSHECVSFGGNGADNCPDMRFLPRDRCVTLVDRSASIKPVAALVSSRFRANHSTFKLGSAWIS